MDKIFLKDLVVKTLIGVDEEERLQPQEVLVNITMETDLKAAAESDDIESTVDYRDIALEVIKRCAETEFYLVETLAELIAEICLAEKGIEKVTVSVEKVGAMDFVDRAGVEITRSRY